MTGNENYVNPLKFVKSHQANLFMMGFSRLKQRTTIEFPIFEFNRSENQ